jgi:rSAM/selenodomain-associated transferase 2
MHPQSPEISVIVPVLDEEAILEQALKRLRALGQCEIIVSDGGSSDRSLEIASGIADIVIRSECGRGIQMRKGAGAAKGGILIFVHADCTLPDGVFDAVRRALSRPGVSACAFDIRIDEDGLAYRIIERLANIRSRAFRTPYGDQALAITRETYESTGGHPQWPLMEDIEIARRIRAHGGRIEFVRSEVIVSSRRWKKRGIVRTTLLDWTLVTAHTVFGVSPERLGRIYYSR